MIKQVFKILPVALCEDVIPLIQQFSKYPIHPCNYQIKNLDEYIDDINPCLSHVIKLQRISFIYKGKIRTVISYWYDFWYEDSIITMDQLLDEFEEHDEFIRNAGDMSLSSKYFTEFEQWVYFESLEIRKIIHKNTSYNLWDQSYIYQYNYFLLSDPVEKFVNKWMYLIAARRTFS